jgi:hypothetical protein
MWENPTSVVAMVGGMVAAVFVLLAVDHRPPHQQKKIPFWRKAKALESVDFEINPMKRCFWCEPAREPCQCEPHFSGSGSI